MRNYSGSSFFGSSRWPSGPSRGRFGQMLGLTHGELGLVAFIVGAILSARFWPRMGEWVARKVSGTPDTEHDKRA